jgi:MFS family permease
MSPGPCGVQHARPNVILAVLSLAALVYAVLASAVIPALPTIQRSLHASETGVTWLGSVAGRVERRFGSRRALVAGAAVSAVACGWLAIASRHPYNMLLCSTLLGVGIGLAFAALGNLIVQAVPAHQTGVASGMNTVLRTLGGALGGQLAATFVAASTVDGVPTLTGFTHTFAMSAGFLVCCVAAGLLVPARAPAVASLQPAATTERA